jgi:nicotinamidase/pyrazinamidase
MLHVSRRLFLTSAAAVAASSALPPAFAQGKLKPGADAALIVVDVQNCFTPGGSLAVGKGDEIVPGGIRRATSRSHPRTARNPSRA